MTRGQQREPIWQAVRHRLMLDKRWQISGGVFLLVLIAACVAFGPIVRSVAQTRAAARGLVLEIGSVRPGWFSVHLGETQVQLPGVPTLSARLDEVIVELNPWLSLRGVTVEGGQLNVNGSLETVMDQLKAWRERQRASRSTSGSDERGRGLALRATGLALAWQGLDATSSVQSIAGIELERDGEMHRAGFESAKLESRWGSLSALGATTSFEATEQGLALRSAKLEQIVGRLAIPVAPPPAADATPVAPAAIAVPPKPQALAGVKGGPASEPERPRWLEPWAGAGWARGRARLAELRELVSRFVAPAAQLEIERVQLEISRGDSVLNIGPAPLRVRRDGDAVVASLTPPAQKDGHQLTVTGKLPLTDDPIAMSFEGGPISLKTLGVREGDFGLLDVHESELTMETRIELSPRGALAMTASGRLSRLALEQAALAPEPLRDMELTWGGAVRLDLEQRKLEITDGVVGVERVRVRMNATLEARPDDLRLSLSVQIPKTPCQDLKDAAPAALLPQLEGLHLGGNFSLDSRVELDTADPKGTSVDWNLDNRCKVLETPAPVDPKRFRQPFQHFVTDSEGRATELTTGPSTEHWVPLADITPAMETALIVCEDSRFFSHNGFDNKAIRDSILDNLRAGHFVRGASTLSMQLAKNLYLGREKTLSRKLQEAAFTLLLEERLSKEDILELYLNVVEFGPGVYGIRNAASHYFNSHPGELSLAQALYLGSILPSPKANHFQEDGTLRPGWAEHLQYLMRIARKINRISDDELEAGLSERIVFGQAHQTTDSDFLFGAPLFELNDG